MQLSQKYSTMRQSRNKPCFVDPVYRRCRLFILAKFFYRFPTDDELGCAALGGNFCLGVSGKH
jgi:hypothetical protein